MSSSVQRTSSAGPPEVIIVGGGPAGLACAVTLQAQGVAVLVLEAGERPGGNVQSERVEGFLLERGPHTVLASADDVFGLAGTLDLLPAAIPSLPTAEDRFIARAGRLHSVPTGPWSLLTSGLLSWRSKLALATEPLRTGRGGPQDSAAQFFERRFGPEAARLLAGAFISGVYAGDPQALSAAAAFPLFWGFERDHGGMLRGGLALRRRRAAERRARGDGSPRRRGLWSFAEGLGQLTQAAAAALGPRCRCGEAAQRVVRADGRWTVELASGSLRAPRLVLAVPPQNAAHLLQDVDAALAGLLEDLPMAPVAVVQLGYREGAAAVPDGFGFLVPRGEGVRTLGVLFPSRLFAGRAPAGGDLLTGFVGGVLDRGALDLDDDALAAVVRADLQTLTGLRTPPDLVRVRRVPAAIPQLVHGHLQRMAEVQQRLAAVPGLRLAGNYLTGVGLKDALRSGIEAGAAVLGDLGVGVAAETAAGGVRP